MYEMPLIFCVWGLGFFDWESIFCIEVLGVGILSLAFCPEIVLGHYEKRSIVPRSSLRFIDEPGKFIGLTFSTRVLICLLTLPCDYFLKNT